MGIFEGLFSPFQSNYCHFLKGFFMFFLYFWLKTFSVLFSKAFLVFAVLLFLFLFFLFLIDLFKLTIG